MHTHVRIGNLATLCTVSVQVNLRLEKALLQAYLALRMCSWG